jgi:signal transduction histidine kinase
LEKILPWVVLATLLIFSYAWFFRVPYAGFRFRPSTGRVYRVYVTTAPEAGLRVGDQLIQVGSVTWEEFSQDRWKTFFDGARPGQVVPITVRREDQTRVISWAFAGPTVREVQGRLINEWFLPYLFWAAGTATLLFARPRDDRWKLLIAFNYLIAVWMATAAPAQWHVWGSLMALYSVAWPLALVCLHLHWVFPGPLGRLPTVVLWPAYLGVGALAAAEWFQLLSDRAHTLALALALAGSLALLAAHVVFKPDQRRDLGFLAIVVALAALPMIAVSVAGLFGAFPLRSAGAFLTLPAIPGVYFYTAYRRRLGGLELRANRLLCLYLFFLLLGAGFILLASLVETRVHFPGDTLFVSLGAGLLAAIATLFGFGPFQRFVERRLLGMPVTPARLLETYAQQITASLDLPTLVQLLQQKVLSTLLVRQSALIRFDETGPVVLYAAGVDAPQLPPPADLPALLDQSRTYRPPAEAGPQPCPWVRLALPLEINRKPVGVWLLGRRDPDDFYAQAEIPTLQALADQTAIALSNIVQAERLRALYQASMDQHEAERTALALELHDEVLNQLAVLSMSVDEQGLTPRFQDSYQRLVTRLRQTISGLRPAMLNYGLRAALEELADELAERAGSGVKVRLEVPPSAARYPPHAEQHLYRIVQQAAENALRHARARTICIQGRLEPEQVDLTIEDDGVGFVLSAALDLPRLAAHRHFGLAGMFERAALVGGEVTIEAAPESGTRVRVVWSPDHRGAANPA